MSENEDLASSFPQVRTASSSTTQRSAPFAEFHVSADAISTPSIFRRSTSSFASIDRSRLSAAGASLSGRGTFSCLPLRHAIIHLFSCRRQPRAQRRTVGTRRPLDFIEQQLRGDSDASIFGRPRSRTDSSSAAVATVPRQQWRRRTTGIYGNAITMKLTFAGSAWKKRSYPRSTDGRACKRRFGPISPTLHKSSPAGMT